ncbi:gluconate 2-dehydrogenase subunit 3 family protein [Flavilitoribacter nigricans]|uniref:Gluconate 2-dehydrogenase subunit 3 family protein n=1 Tax=Flavilitoribacter nigricans (strain ATCC 23147 / DSM 23189 / NBRC 102662 / NCIMB 1420 / SS-2) TaxID=1122177 RepID=A0A2D0NEK6_FLAN2|nr:gluconate 2-dehydrogenase subunit 3 family protein [Flavilitoribacter nigricans]PHN06932.1 hypothetical protein CRP01_08945 [Flavilitoribacter nigricans DSM 23189 = NBRC 102662]
MINRREALKRAGLLLGSAVSASVISGVMQGCKPSYSIDWEPQFLSEEQAVLVGEIAETILPETDTLGAKSLHLDEFIDLMLQEVYTADEQTAFTAGLAELERTCVDATGQSFPELSAADRLSFLQAEEQAARKDGASAAGKSLLQLKELTLVGYFTSEYAGTDVLEFKPVPGHYHGCVNYQDGPAQIGMRI